MARSREVAATSHGVRGESERPPAAGPQARPIIRPARWPQRAGQCRYLTVVGGEKTVYRPGLHGDERGPYQHVHRLRAERVGNELETGFDLDFDNGRALGMRILGACRSSGDPAAAGQPNRQSNHHGAALPCFR